MLLLRTGQTVGMLELTRLAACRGDVVMTIAFMVQFGASLKKVTNGNKILQKGILIKTRPYGITGYRGNGLTIPRNSSFPGEYEETSQSSGGRSVYHQLGGDM